MKNIKKSLGLLALLPNLALAAIIDDPKGAPRTDAAAVTELIDRVQGMVAAIAGAVAFAMIIWGAVTLLSAGGNEEKMGKAKKILTYAIGGLIFILLAEIFIKVFIEALGGSIS